MKYSITILLLLIISSAPAQTIINARIISDKGKTAVPYATIVVKNNTVSGASSDVDGWFSLRCNVTDSLDIRSLGYKSISVLASDAFRKKMIELTEDTITLSEISISAENAYKMLFRARDSTNKYQMKSFQGICLRQDKLSFNGKTERKSDAKIIFKTRKIKNGHTENDYWLKDLKSESYSKTADLPYMSYPNTIPLILYELIAPSPEELSDIKCTIISNSDIQMIINVKTAKPTKYMINDATYIVNKKTWIFKGFEYKGDFKINPLKKWNRYNFLTNINLTYNNIGDSCILENFNYKIVFSHKKVDPQNLWEYQMNMDITPQSSDVALPEGRKLLKVDYLLFKKNSDNTFAK